MDPKVMEAAVIRRPTSPEALTVSETEVPALAAGGVLVRIRASSANTLDLFALSPVAHFARRRKPDVAGTDFAGTVEAVGDGVTRLRPGDDVFGALRGAFAEYGVVNDHRGVVLKPAGISFEDAGTLAVAGTTALQAVRDYGGVESGQHVLINGASGGVGTFAVQIAKALGAEVTGVCSTRNVDLIRAIGAHHVIDYTIDDFTRSGERFDVLLDVAGSRSWSECARVIKPGGTYVGVGAAALQHGRGGAGRLIRHVADVRIRSLGGGKRVVVYFLAKLNQPDLETLGQLVESGQVKAAIDRRYDLTQVGDALSYINEGHASGKVAIRVGV
jgi:NADPH:quinone reductase-like Zn-dependent oxidoreductase